MTALASPGTCRPCSKSELAYNAMPYTQTVITDNYNVYCGPQSTISEHAPLTFEIPGSEADFTDLSNTFLKLRLKVTTAAGEDVTDANAPALSLSNNVLNTLFSQVDVTLNDTLVSQSSNLHGYRAYVENLLSYTSLAKKSFLKVEGFCPDTAGHFDNPAQNGGHAERRKWITDGKELELLGRIHSDLFHTDLLIPNGVTIKLTLTPAKTTFVLTSHDAQPPDFALQITHASLEVRKVKLAPKEQLRIEQALVKTGLQLPLTHSTVKSFAIPSGVSQFDIENLVSGQIPSRILLGLVSDEALNGTLSKNPFKFDHYDLNFLALHVGGRQLPARPLQPDFGKGEFLDCYTTLFSNLGGYGASNHDLTTADYIGGNTLYCFNLTPDGGDGVSHLSPRTAGQVRASLHFARNLPSTAALFVYCQYDNILTIDRYRNVVFDFAS